MLSSNDNINEISKKEDKIETINQNANNVKSETVQTPKDISEKPKNNIINDIKESSSKKCNYCKYTNKKLKYRCLKCKDYYLCEECYNKNIQSKFHEHSLTLINDEKNEINIIKSDIKETKEKDYPTNNEKSNIITSKSKEEKEKEGQLITPKGPTKKQTQEEHEKNEYEEDEEEEEEEDDDEQFETDINNILIDYFYENNKLITKEASQNQLNGIKEFYIFLKERNKNVSDFQKSFIKNIVEKDKKSFSESQIKLIDKRINTLNKLLNSIK